MARVREIQADELTGEARRMYEHMAGPYGGYRGMAAALAHRPVALEHLVAMLAGLKADPVNQRRHLEIAMLAASKVNECHYCVAHHTPYLLDLGLPMEAVERILEPDCPGFDDVDRLVRDYAVEVSLRAHYLRDDLLARMKANFTEQQIVDLTLRITLNAFFNRFNAALGIELEEGFGTHGLGHHMAAE